MKLTLALNTVTDAISIHFYLRLVNVVKMQPKREREREVHAPAKKYPLGSFVVWMHLNVA